MPSPFETERLVFRALDLPIAANNNDQTDVNFMYECNYADPISHAQSDCRLFKPEGLERGEAMIKFLKECLLTVVICIKPEFDHLKSEDGDSEASTDANAKPTKKKFKPIGFIHLTGHAMARVHLRNSEIGLSFLKDYQGKGFGTEAINWTLDWGFRQAGLHRIGIGCFGFNKGAERLYARLGFVLEARKREFMWFDGGWHDMVEFAMLEDEWRALRAKQTDVKNETRQSDMTHY